VPIEEEEEAFGSLTVPALTYSFEIINWHQEQL
jgi:hypothetical protein